MASSEAAKSFMYNILNAVASGENCGRGPVHARSGNPEVNKCYKNEDILKSLKC